MHIVCISTCTLLTRFLAPKIKINKKITPQDTSVSKDLSAYRFYCKPSVGYSWVQDLKLALEGLSQAQVRKYNMRHVLIVSELHHMHV